MQVIHQMSPAGVIIVLAFSLVMDVLQVGPEWIRDRIAFAGALCAFYEGFCGSSVERWTVGLVAGALKIGLSWTGDAYIRGAAQGANGLIGGLLVILAVYVIGVMLPPRASGRLGGFTRLNWRTQFFKKAKVKTVDGATAGEKGALNKRMWICACTLGLMADLPQGPAGDLYRSAIFAIDGLVAVVPGLLRV